MKIGIDGRPALGKRTGVGNYTYNLIKYLGEIDRENEYLIFYSFLRKKTCDEKLVRWANFKEKSVRFPSRILELSWRYLPFFSIENLIGKMDIFHSTNFVSPLQKQSKSIITIHDLGFMIFPENADKHIQTYFRKWVPRCVQEADVIITVSQNSKEDIIKLLKIPKEKIKVIYNGIDEIYQPGKKDESFFNLQIKYKIPEKYILYVGTLEPRKNLNRLIESFSLLKKEGREEKLVIAGEKGWSYESIFQTVERLNLRKEVIFTGYIAQEDLPFLYNGASLFVFPSLYEGFGIPPLEAMACGVPVITSKVSSLPEIMEEGAIFVDPYNIEELALVMRNVLSKEELRLDLIKKGLSRAKMFSWRKTAQATLKIYQEIL